MAAIVFIKTYGCTLNQSDSEVMAGILLEQGYTLATSMADANVVIINTCTVKDNPEKKFWYELKNMPKEKKVIAAGCIPQSDPDNPLLKNVSLVGTMEVSRIGDAVRLVLDGKKPRFISWEQGKRLNLLKKRRNTLVEVIPISAGCIGDCSYCRTKYARGNLVSFSPAEIERQFCSAVKEGIKEIWLTSQDTGAYGIDIKTDLSELLERLLKYDGDYRIRVGMMNPNNLLRIKEKLVPIFRDSHRIYKFIHLPLQSASDKVLKDMNRFYTKEDFLSLVKELRESIPEISIATDIICGFPTETDQDFNETLEFCRKVGFDAINISKFCARPGTRAYSLKRLDSRIVKDRSLRMTRLFYKVSAEKNKAWIGWKGKCYFYEKAKHGTIVGKNIFFRQVVLKADDSLLGKELDVRIVGAGAHDLKAVLM